MQSVDNGEANIRDGMSEKGEKDGNEGGDSNRSLKVTIQNMATRITYPESDLDKTAMEASNPNNVPATW